MSPFIASLAVAAIFLVALAPIALASMRVIGWAPSALFTLLLIGGVTSVQAGLFLSAPPLPEISAARTGAIQDAQCAEVITALERARLILDRRAPPRLIVSRQLWAQMPMELRGVVLDCVRRAWPENAAEPELEMRAQ